MAIPAALDAAIPRGSRTPATTGAIAWHHFNKAMFDVGREEIPIPGTDQSIGIYSAERSITDAFRLRGEVGYELAREALKEWLRRQTCPTDGDRLSPSSGRSCMRWRCSRERE